MQRTKIVLQSAASALYMLVSKSVLNTKLTALVANVCFFYL